MQNLLHLLQDLDIPASKSSVVISLLDNKMDEDAYTYQTELSLDD